MYPITLYLGVARNNVLKLFRRRGCEIFLFLLFPFFFIVESGYESSRVVKEVWNLGHVLFFAILATKISTFPLRKDPGSHKKNSYILLLVLLIASAIEVCQSFIPGRLASWLDILLGLAGALMVLSWRKARLQRAGIKIIYKVLASSILVACLMPLIFTLIDEYRIWRNFPVLSDFESFLDVSRWQGDSKLFRVSAPVKSGNFSLMVPLNTEKYSGVTLAYLRGNWKGGRALSFSVYNSEDPIVLNYRVHDILHTGLQNYSDRFNGSSVLFPGWNTIVIPMSEIEKGPKYRKMDIEHIRNFGVFVIEQPQDRVLYIDDVKLLMHY